MLAFKNNSPRTLAVIGAGPKGLAVAVKAQVLQEFGLSSDRVVLIEKNGVAAHWSGEHGYTNGEMKLGTSPEKDVVYPLNGLTGDQRLDQRIRRRLMDFTWTSFLVQTERFSDWVDRGKPAPCHQLWADYLQWVARQLIHPTAIVKAAVTRIDLTENRRQWRLTLHDVQGRSSLIAVDRLMLTGPGKTRADFIEGEVPPQGVYDLESFWSQLTTDRFPLKGRLAIVGTGENAASVLLALAKYAPGLRADVISPKGFVTTRAENFYENRFYSQPEQNGWEQLDIADRLDFIKRTDLGVFSTQAMQVLNEEVRHRIVPGRLVQLQSGPQGLSLQIRYNDRLKTEYYDQVILATGFDQTAMLRSLLTPTAVDYIEKTIAAPFEQKNLSRRIQKDLSVEGLLPALHMPMLAGLMQGPGFANLSCLGLLSDRIVTEPTLTRIRKNPSPVKIIPPIELDEVAL